MRVGVVAELDSDTFKLFWTLLGERHLTRRGFPRVRWRDPGLMACNPFGMKIFMVALAEKCSFLSRYSD